MCIKSTIQGNNIIRVSLSKERVRVKNKEKLFDALSPDDKMKLEIAEELGLLDQVQSQGWKSLSAKETGRIGGLMTKKKRQMSKEAKENNSEAES